jgi:hypothetical protein
MAEYIPVNDGVDHVNIYSKSGCNLGRLLSNFSHTPFTHPKYGEFASMEGFWFYISTGLVCEDLRTLYGNKAKICGKQLKVVKRDDFLSIMEEGLRCKLNCNQYIGRLLIQNDLPLTHYYYFGKLDNCKVVYPKDWEWLPDTYTKIKNKVLEKPVPKT